MKYLKCNTCGNEIDITHNRTFDTCPKCGSMKLFVWEKAESFVGALAANIQKEAAVVVNAVKEEVKKVEAVVEKVTEDVKKEIKKPGRPAKG